MTSQRKRTERSNTFSKRSPSAGHLNLKSRSIDMDSLKEVKKQLHQNGFAVVENAFTEEEVDEIRTEMARIIEEMNPDDHPRTLFNTYDEKKHASDTYFLNSADKIRFFYEEGAVDSGGKLTVPKQLALNKVGHALHWLNPVFKKISFSDKIKNIFRAIDFAEPQIVQSMYIFKQPTVGGAVDSHIDATFLYAEPINNLVGIWIAVDEANQENGCLAFIPGSHNVSDVKYRFKRTHTTEGPLVQFEGQKPVYDLKKFVPLPVKKGSVVLIHGLVAHRSEANTSARPRHAYTMHVLDGKDTVWSKDNWLQETSEYSFPQLYEN